MARIRFEQRGFFHLVSALYRFRKFSSSIGVCQLRKQRETTERNYCLRNHRQPSSCLVVLFVPLLLITIRPGICAGQTHHTLRQYLVRHYSITVCQTTLLLWEHSLRRELHCIHPKTPIYSPFLCHLSVLAFFSFPLLRNASVKLVCIAQSLMACFRFCG